MNGFLGRIATRLVAPETAVRPRARARFESLTAERESVQHDAPASSPSAGGVEQRAAPPSALPPLEHERLADELLEDPAGRPRHVAPETRAERATAEPAAVRASEPDDSRPANVPASPDPEPLHLDVERREPERVSPAAVRVHDRSSAAAGPPPAPSTAGETPSASGVTPAEDRTQRGGDDARQVVQTPPDPIVERRAQEPRPPSLAQVRHEARAVEPKSTERTSLAEPSPRYAAEGRRDGSPGPSDRAVEEPPTVRVTIGRLEIRSTAPAPVPVARRQRAPVRTLDDVLKKRRRGRDE